MRISELAESTATTPKTLRFYEQAGLLPEPERAANGYRDYDQSAAARITFIRAGQALGLTLAQIRALMLIRDDGRAPCAEAIDLIDSHIRELGARIAEMQTLRRDLQGLRNRARNLRDSDCAPDSVCHIISPALCSCQNHDPSSPSRA